MKHGRWQAKDIEDGFFLRCVEWASYQRFPPGALASHPYTHFPHWVHTWTLEALMPVFPIEVIRSKAGALIRRGLLTGCDCGCRGDFELTPQGSAFLVASAHGPR